MKKFVKYPKINRSDVMCSVDTAYSDNLDVLDEVDTTQFAYPEIVERMLQEVVDTVEEIVAKYPQVQYKLRMSTVHRGGWGTDFLAIHLTSDKYWMQGEEMVTTDLIETPEGWEMQENPDTILNECAQVLSKAAKKYADAHNWIAKKVESDLKDVPIDVQKVLDQYQSYINRHVKPSTTIDELIEDFQLDYINNARSKHDYPEHHAEVTTELNKLIQFMQQSNLTAQDIAKLSRICRGRSNRQFSGYWT